MDPASATPPRARRRLQVVVAAALTVIVAAVAAAALALRPSGRPGGTPEPSGIAGAAPSPAAAMLAAADALFFSNQYGDAGRAYADAVRAHPADASVHAADALFLVDRRDADGALREAERATALDPRSGRAAAVLCRVDDWSNRLEAARTAGARAVDLAPGDPLAHLFDSEALADGGDDQGARAQLDAAARLIGPSSSEYLRAELERERANLAHDIGDPAGQVTALRAALTAQPGWVERATELAGAALDDGDLPTAHQAFATAISLAPDDVDLLTGLGQTALFQSDYDAAARAYRHALRLRPDDPTLLLLNAQVDVALDHDTAAATALVERALTADPRDEQAAAYLLRVAADLEHDAARGRAEVAEAVAASEEGADPRSAREHPAPPDPDARAAAHARVALAEVNRVRVSAGLPAVVLDPALTASARSHAWYWIYNNASPTVAGLGIHRETPGLAGYTGAGPADRAVAAGWRSAGVGEDITHRDTPLLAVRDWVDSVYHRFPVLRPDLRAIGFADAVVGPISIDDMEFGLTGAATGAAPVAFPAGGATDVPDIFVDNELPDPVPPGRPRTTGYPVTVTFAPGSTVLVTSFTLVGPGGGALDAYRLMPSPQTENSASLLPVRPLLPAARYTATITGTVDGRPSTRTWSFTTAGAPSASPSP